MSQIQQPSRSSDYLSILQFEIDAANINPTLADLEYDRVFAFGIFLQVRFLHERMRVATRDEIDAAHLGGQLCIADLITLWIWVISQVRHAHN